MIQQVEGLEREARELERKASESISPGGQPVPSVQQQQVQQQQQHEVEERPSDLKDSGHKPKT